jgi:hypothetical protein
MHHRDERTVLVDQPEQLGELSVTADKGARPLVEYVPQGPGHAVVWADHTSLPRGRPRFNRL